MDTPFGKFGHEEEQIPAKTVGSLGAEAAETPAVPDAVMNIDRTDAEDFMKKAGLPTVGDAKGDEDPKLKAELEKHRQEAQKLIDSYKKFFVSFAGDSSLDFVMSNGFYIDLESGKVNLDIKWFREQGYTNDQIVWAVMHEISHFRDMAENPEGMMKNFGYIQDQARKTGDVILKKWEDAFGASDPEFVDSLRRQRPINPKKPEKGTMNRVQQGAYDIHHRFFNIFDDIYVNNMVSREAPAYRPGKRGGDEVRRLYHEKLFKGTDYSKNPRHMQFVDSLLREEMVQDEEVAVGDDVAEALSRKIIFQGKEYTAKEIVEKFIKPRIKRDTNPEQRYFILQHTLEPVYLDLLMKDIADWQPEKQKKQEGKGGQGGEGGEGEDGDQPRGGANPFDQQYEDERQKNPDQLSPEDIKDWMEKNKKDQEEAKKAAAKKAAESKKTPEQKANEQQAAMDAEWCAENGISKETMGNYRSVQREVAPYLEELTQLWTRIIYGHIKELEQGIEGHFKTGTELDVQEAIQEWPKIEKGDLTDVRIMKKIINKEQLVEKPELIRMRLLADLSGSMDQKKKEILRQVYVLLFSSLQQFNTLLNIERSRTKSKLRVETQGIAYGSSEQTKVIKQLPQTSAENDEQLEVIRGFEALNENLGSTGDDRALAMVMESLAPEDKKKIASEKIMDMVFEVTDGGSDDARATRAALDHILDANLIARGFQIGAVSESDKEKFQYVWNRGRTEKLGEEVGEEIGNLTPAIAEALKKYLSQVRL